MSAPADFRFENHGSLWLMYALSSAGQDWAEQHIASGALRHGEAYVIEPRFVRDVVHGAIADNLAVCALQF